MRSHACHVHICALLPEPSHIPEEVRIIYLIASVTFLIEYVARGLAANNKLKYMFWDMSLIDAATIAYGFFTYFVPGEWPWAWACVSEGSAHLPWLMGDSAQGQVTPHSHGWLSTMRA